MIDAKKALEMTMASIDDETMDCARKQVEYSIKQHANEGHRIAHFRRGLFPEVVRCSELLKPELNEMGFGVEICYTDNLAPQVMTVRW